MTIMFQLFSARDLQMLAQDELEELKNIVITAMNDNKGLKLQDYQTSVKESTERPKLRQPPTLGISNNTEPLPDTPQGNSMLKKRLNEVVKQLRDSRESAPYDRTSVEKASARQSTRDQSDELDEKEKLILQWALSCERNFLEFYAPLRRARNVAHEYFREKTGQRPEGPDSSYSPFSPEHPLRRRSSDLYDC